MPVSPIQAVASLVPNLGSMAIIGVAVPKFAQGFGMGLMTWTQTITISTTDAGAAGAGKGAPVPIFLPQPVLVVNLMRGFQAYGLIGLMEPLFVTGLSNGLVQLYLQAFTNTVHPGVGSGAGVARFNPPPAATPFIQGFQSVGMTGEGAVKVARALAQGMEATFRSLVLPQPIVGPVGPSPGSGVGTGKII